MHRLSSFVLLLIIAAAAFSQTGDQAATFRADARLVPLHATVVDKNGRLVSNLAREAFKVYENDVEQQIKLFRREDVPVSMGLVIDNSGSMRDKRKKVEAAALQLVKESNREDEVFIVNFNDDAFLDVPFTNDVKKLEEGLARIDSRGGTAMRDAISMSIDWAKDKGKKDKKVLLVITDGDDNTSGMTLEKLVEKAQQSEVLIYAIGILSQEERREAKRAERALKALTMASGGVTFLPKELEEVEKLASQVAHDIRNQYTITYTPLNQVLDGSYRRIRVVANGPNRPTVRTRTGYYASATSGKKATVSQAAPTNP